MNNHIGDANKMVGAAPIAIFQARSTHSVYRGSCGHLPCYCWADSDHIIGDEVKRFSAATVAEMETVGGPEVVSSKSEPTTPAAPGIDTVSILEIVAKYVGRTSSAYRYIAEDLKHIDASPKGGSDGQDAARYRYLRRPAAWTEDYISRRGAVSAVFVSDGKVGHATDMQALDDAIDAAMQATSAEVGS